MTECQAKPRSRAPFAVRKVAGRWHVYARWQRAVDGRVYEEGEADCGRAYSWDVAMTAATATRAVAARARLDPW